MIEELDLKCSVGALLYSPALNTTVAESVINGKFVNPYSLAICLEDTVSDAEVSRAEQEVYKTISTIAEAEKDRQFYLPKIFVRVRNAGQILRLYSEGKAIRENVTGFILPKYDLTNSEDYNEAIIQINKESDRTIYMMPILESFNIVDYSSRDRVLAELKSRIDSVSEYVLNIRVGGNDFSNIFGVRRHSDEIIYDILPIAHILSEIVTVFSGEYVISAPVWEYFSGEDSEWETGMKKELKHDLLNGFIGKSVIHPNQIRVVNDALRVSKKDYDDAKAIMNWGDRGLLVGKSLDGERMNEVKTHSRWAYKTLVLAGLYGVC